MAGTVSIKELIFGFEAQGSESQTYVNRESGEIWVAENHLISMAEEDEAPEFLPEWQKPEWERAKQMIDNDDWLMAPSPFDIHEWQIMKDYAQSVQSAQAREELERAIHGRGAFRAFKLVLSHYHLFDEWNSFRESTLRDMAIEWCEDNGLKWCD